MSRINQFVVASATFSVALGIGFVMQNGDALAARLAETPAPTIPAAAMQAGASPAVVSRLPREGTAAWLVRQRIEKGVTAAIVAAPPMTDAMIPVAATEEVEAPILMAAASPTAETPSLPTPEGDLLVLSVPDETVGEATPPELPEAPVLEAALGMDAVPDVPLPEALHVPDCAVGLAATALPAALVELILDAPCSPSARATIHHQGMIFTIVTDDEGQARLTVPALAEGAVFLADLGEGGGGIAVVTVPDIAEYDRAVLQWQGVVGPEIHALEFGAAHGDAGHVWHGAPRAADVAVAGTGGFLMRLGDGAGLNPHLAEVYTYPSSATQQTGHVKFTVETPVTDQTCGRELQAQTIQVSPGAEPFAFDLALAVPGCEFTGEILVLRDMILDLTVASR